MNSRDYTQITARLYTAVPLSSIPCNSILQ